MKILLLGVGLVALLIVGSKLWDFGRAVRLRRIAVERCVVPKQKLEGRGYLRGRVAVVNANEKKWDWLIGNYLPDDVVARSAAEISTCVVLDWNWKAAGIFEVETTQGGVTVGKHKEVAKRQTCKVTVIDLSKHAIVAEELIEGPPPSDGWISDGKNGRSPSDGHKPVEEVEDFILKLPRQAL